MALFERRGTPENPRIVTAEEFLAALAGNDEKVELEHCVIKGEVDISKAGIEPDGKGKYFIDKKIVCKDCCFTDVVSFRHAMFQEDVKFKLTTFKGNAFFRNATFEKKAGFRYATFCSVVHYSIGANFIETKFEAGADFYGATFEGDAYFNCASFNCEVVNFTGIKRETPLYFAHVRYWPDTVFNKGLRGLPESFVSSLTYPLEDENDSTKKSKKYKYPSGRPCKEADFHIDSQNIDEINSPRFKRYVADQQFIRAFKKEQPLLARLWRWSSDYGRSFGLWAFWSGWLATIFGCAYAQKRWGFIGLTGVVLLVVGISNVWRLIKSGHISKEKVLRSAGVIAITLGLLTLVYWASFTIDQLEFAVSGREFTLSLSYKDFTLKFVSPERIPNFWTYLYFSVVTFTTLGFGDVIPLNNLSERWVMVEVILGYVMLGGLISIFANKLARRS